MDGTKIEWADATWNPVIGCEQVSPGCANCYAKTLVETRFRKDFGVPDFKPHKDLDPLRWKRPRVIFPNSLSDLFWDAIPDAQLDRWFAIMALAHWHTFMLLTKRHDRMLAYLRDPATKERISKLQVQLCAESKEVRKNIHQGFAELLTDPGDNWPIQNLKLGVSAENQHWWDIRLAALRAAPAAFRWVSAEPLLGIIHPEPADLAGIDLVIGGGESGPRARPTFRSWAVALRDGTLKAGKTFDWKQWGEWAPVQELSPSQTKPGWAYVHDHRGVQHFLPMTKVIDRLPSDGLMARFGKKSAGRLIDGTLYDYRKDQQHVDQ